MRILVLTSAGFLLRPGVPPELANFIDGAVRWNIVVHAIDAKGLAPPGAIGDSKDGLRRDLPAMPLANIANGTGGHFFGGHFFKDTNDLAGAMQLAANPEVTYLLAFNPGSRDGKFHTLKIRFKSKRADSIQFRPGYFSPDQKKEQSARAPFDDAVFSKQTLRDVPATVAVAAGQSKDGTVPVSVSITLDLNRVQFVTANGRHMQQIVFLMTLLDANGGFVTGKDRSWTSRSPTKNSPRSKRTD